MGRPPKVFKPEYCEKLIQHMAAGLSFETFGATIGASRSQIYDWLHEIPEFMDAKNSAVDLCQLFWEQKGVDGLYSTKSASFNQAVWIFNMKARFRWKDEEPKAPEQLPEKQAMTLEEKRLLLTRAKEQIQKLEEELKVVNE